jgi:hypothetical protein
MHTTGLALVGLLLIVVAAVPLGWQDQRFVRFLEGDDDLSPRPSPPRHRLRARLISVTCFVVGVVFLLLAFR